jgi:hypothetical protein
MDFGLFFSVCFLVKIWCGAGLDISIEVSHNVRYNPGGFMKKVLLFFILLYSTILYSEDMTISLVNHKFDPLANPPVLEEKLRDSEKKSENYYILQFTGPIYSNWKNEISERGGIFHSYIPHFAYIVQMTTEEKKEIEKLSFVRWIGLFNPEYKIHPDVFKKRVNEEEKILPVITAKIEDNKVKIIKKQQCNCGKDALWVTDDPLLHLYVTAFHKASLNNIAQKIETWGSDIQNIHETSNRIIVRIPPDSLNALANLEEIQSILPYPKKVLSSSTWRYSVQTPMDSFTIQHDEDLEEIWDTVTNGITLADKGVTGEGEIITIFDSGLDYWSAFFQDPEDDPPGPSHIVVEAYTAEGGDLQEVSSDNEPGGCSHGTNVATIIAGNLSISDNHPNGGNLMHYYDWGGQTRGNVIDHFPVRLYIQDFGYLESDTCKLGDFDFTAAINKAYNTYDSKIHQDSWNYDNLAGSYVGAAVDLDEMVWDNKDFVVVFSAGNKGPDNNTIMPPATAKNCITVGSSWVPTFDVSPDSITGFSSRGWTSDGRIKPDVVAPGGSNPFEESRHYIWGAKANTIWAGDSAHPNLQGMAGTSQAAPHISATCAMIRQYFKDGFYPSGDTLFGIPFEPSAALVKAVLIASTVDMQDGNPVPNRTEGWGRVVLDNALYFAGEPRALIVSDNEQGVSREDSSINLITVLNSAEPLKIVLAWSDTAAYPLANPTLVNDLDLIVTAPGGDRYRGNVFSEGFSTTEGSFDRLNNVEVVWLQTPQTGIYTISVRGHNTPTGRTPFAMAVSGGTSGTIRPPDDEESEVKYMKIRNPFVDETQIQLLLTDTSNVNLTIYDILGRKMLTLLDNQTIEPDSDPVTWGNNAKPGIYFAVLEIDGEKTAEEKIIKIAR